MAEEEEELILRVRLDDQSRAQIAAMQEQLRGMGGDLAASLTGVMDQLRDVPAQMAQAMQVAVTQLQQVQTQLQAVPQQMAAGMQQTVASLKAAQDQMAAMSASSQAAAAKVGAVPGLVQQGVGAMTAALGRAGFIMGFVGGVTQELTKRLLDMGGELIGRATDFKAYSDSIVTLNNAAKASGTGSAQFRANMDVFKESGITAEEATQTLQKASAAQADLQRRDSQIRQSLFAGHDDPRQRERIAQYADLMKEANPEQFLELVKRLADEAREVTTEREGAVRGAEAEKAVYEKFGFTLADVRGHFRTLTAEEQELDNQRVAGAQKMQTDLAQTAKEVDRITTALAGSVTELINMSGVLGGVKAVFREIAEVAEGIETTIRNIQKIANALRFPTTKEVEQNIQQHAAAQEAAGAGGVAQVGGRLLQGLEGTLGLEGPSWAGSYAGGAPFGAYRKYLALQRGEAWDRDQARPRREPEAPPAAPAAPPEPPPWWDPYGWVTRPAQPPAPPKPPTAPPAAPTPPRYAPERPAPPTSAVPAPPPVAEAEPIVVTPPAEAPAAAAVPATFAERFGAVPPAATAALPLPPIDVQRQMPTLVAVPSGVPGVEAPVVPSAELTPEQREQLIRNAPPPQTDQGLVRSDLGIGAARYAEGFAPQGVTQEFAAAPSPALPPSAAATPPEAPATFAERFGAAEHATLLDENNRALKELSDALNRFTRGQPVETQMSGLAPGLGADGGVVAGPPKPAPTDEPPKPAIELTEPPKPAPTDEPPKPAAVTEPPKPAPETDFPDLSKQWWKPPELGSIRPGDFKSEYTLPEGLQRDLDQMVSAMTATPLETGKQKDARNAQLDKWSEATMPEISSKLDQAASQNIDISGTGRIAVDVNAPSGTSVRAEAEGFFKATEITRQTQMLPAEMGPMSSTGVSAGAGALSNGTV